MLEEQIDKKREELNLSIENGEDYANIYKLSVELDELIADYYKEAQVKRKEKNKKIYKIKKEENKIVYIV